MFAIACFFMGNPNVNKLQEQAAAQIAKANHSDPSMFVNFIVVSKLTHSFWFMFSRNLQKKIHPVYFVPSLTGKSNWNLMPAQG